MHLGRTVEVELCGPWLDAPQGCSEVSVRKSHQDPWEGSEELLEYRLWYEVWQGSQPGKQPTETYGMVSLKNLEHPLKSIKFGT